MRASLIFGSCICFIIYGCIDPESPKDWKRVDISTNANLNVITFIDDNVGFIGATQKSPLSEATYSFIDGSYFDYVNEVHINSDSIKYFHVEFSAQHPEPVLFKTTDGGQTWLGISTSFISDVVDISFIDERSGYVMTSKEGLYKTVDGGMTWKRVLSNVAFLGNQRIVNNPFQKIHFFTALEGIAFHEDKGVVVKTLDGGKNWFIVPYFDIQCESCGLENVLFLNGSKTGFAVYRSKFLKTLDAGETWEEIAFTTPYDENGLASYMNDLTFRDLENGAMLFQGRAFQTTDGGRTWQDVADRPITGDKILLKEEDQLYLQYHGNPSLQHFDLSTRELNSFSSEGDASTITDWCFAGNRILAVGGGGILLKFDIR